MLPSKPGMPMGTFETKNPNFDTSTNTVHSSIHAKDKWGGYQHVEEAPSYDNAVATEAANAGIEVKTPALLPDSAPEAPPPLSLGHVDSSASEGAKSGSSGDACSHPQQSPTSSVSDAHASESDGEEVKQSIDEENAANTASGYKSLPQPLSNGATSFILNSIIRPFVLAPNSHGAETKPSDSATASASQHPSERTVEAFPPVSDPAEPSRPLPEAFASDVPELPRLKVGTKRASSPEYGHQPPTPPSGSEPPGMDLDEKPVKRRKTAPAPALQQAAPVAVKVPVKGGSKAGGSGNGPRSCVHCGTLKTPLWRNGPLGPKSLCNACGVRHKLGKLTSEYSPYAPKAATPTKQEEPKPVAVKRVEAPAKRRQIAQPQRATEEQYHSIADRPKRVCVASSRAAEYAAQQHQRLHRPYTHMKNLNASDDDRDYEPRPRANTWTPGIKMPGSSPSSLSPSEGAMVLLSLAGLIHV